MPDICGRPVQKPGKSRENSPLYTSIATASVVILRCSCEILHKLVTDYVLFVHRFTHTGTSPGLSSPSRLCTLPTGLTNTTALNLIRI